MSRVFCGATHVVSMSSHAAHTTPNEVEAYFHALRGSHALRATFNAVEATPPYISKRF
jgi:hypothetical protein